MDLPLLFPDEKGPWQKRPVDVSESTLVDLPRHLLTATHPEEGMWTDSLGDEQQSCSESHLMITLFPPASCVKMHVFHCIAGLAVPCGVAQVS